MKRDTSRPLIESIINTSALALTSYAVLQITSIGNNWGYLALIVGISIEWFKYFGRKRQWW